MNKFNFMQISSDILIQTELTIEKNQQEQLNNSTNNVNDDNLSPNNRDRNRQYTTSTYDLWYIIPHFHKHIDSHKSQIITLTSTPFFLIII